jgi:hypothetical protein
MHRLGDGVIRIEIHRRLERLQRRRVVLCRKPTDKTQRRERDVRKTHQSDDKIAIVAYFFVGVRDADVHKVIGTVRSLLADLAIVGVSQVETDCMKVDASSLVLLVGTA